ASCGGHRPCSGGRRRVPDRGRRRHRGRRAPRRSLPDRGQRHHRDCGRDRRRYADRGRRLAQPLHRGRTGVDLSRRADRPGGLRLRRRQERPREGSPAWPRPDRGRCGDRCQHHHRPRSRPRYRDRPRLLHRQSGANRPQRAHRARHHDRGAIRRRGQRQNRRLRANCRTSRGVGPPHGWRRCAACRPERHNPRHRAGRDLRRHARRADPAMAPSNRTVGATGKRQSVPGMNETTPKKTVERMNIEDILEAIPHRYPFLMIDRVIDVIPDESAIGIKNVSINESYFHGHFPRRPVMPGVLIIESMAQSAAVLVVATLGPAMAGKLVYFMSIDDCRFRRPVVPGDQLFVHVTKKHRRRNVWKFEARAAVDDQTVAEATYSAMILDDS
ncbi:3-hydroxyacyl-[acyl-carrier-protein] dehydratase FabZ, partial [Geodia barretti]